MGPNIRFCLNAFWPKCGLLRGSKLGPIIMTKIAVGLKVLFNLGFHKEIATIPCLARKNSQGFFFFRKSDKNAALKGLEKAIRRQSQSRCAVTIYEAISHKNLRQLTPLMYLLPVKMIKKELIYCQRPHLHSHPFSTSREHRYKTEQFATRHSFFYQINYNHDCLCFQNWYQQQPRQDFSRFLHQGHITQILKTADRS